jgi:hypothetical protein
MTEIDLGAPITLLALASVLPEPFPLTKDPVREVIAQNAESGTARPMANVVLSERNQATQRVLGVARTSRNR